MKKLCYLFCVLFGLVNGAQAQSSSDSTMVRAIFDQALVHGEAYSNLRVLCKSIGHRLSGSPQAQQAVLWGNNVLNDMALDTVYLQPITIPFWVRGSEYAELNGDSLYISTLGGSVGTKDTLTASVIEVNGIEDVENLKEAQVKGKFVFYNRPMDPRNINTFQSYGGCVDQRYAGAMTAAEKGAVGVLVRSMTLLEDDHHAHTGSMGYKDGVEKIPAVALSTSSANKLHNTLARGEAEVKLHLTSHTKPDTNSANVIGEIRGSEHPEKIILVGGHLDSWDVGEGAHDDGAGIVHSMEVLRIFKALGYQPRHTIRVVLFMNEENGNMGGKSYAQYSKAHNEDHIAALESDRGGFSPRGFSLKGDSSQLAFIAQFKDVLEPYGLHLFEIGFAGVDINPLIETRNLVDPELMLLGLVPDSQRYFDFHHTEIDVFENVNKRELELGCASMASMVYLLDQHLK